MSKIFERLYEDYTAERRALGVPARHDGFPVMAVQSSQNPCNEFINLVLASPEVTALALNHIFGRETSPGTKTKIVYLPAIDPATGFGDPCGSCSYDLEEKDKNLFVDQVQTYYARMHTNLNDLTGLFMRNLDIVRVPGRGCDLTLPRLSNGAGESDDHWRKRTGEAALYIRKLFSGVAAVADDNRANGRIVIRTRDFTQFESRLEPLFR